MRPKRLRHEAIKLAAGVQHAQGSCDHMCMRPRPLTLSLDDLQGVQGLKLEVCVPSLHIAHGARSTVHRPSVSYRLCSFGTRHQGCKDYAEPLLWLGPDPTMASQPRIQLHVHVRTFPHSLPFTLEISNPLLPASKRSQPSPDD